MDELTAADIDAYMGNLAPVPCRKENEIPFFQFLALYRITGIVLFPWCPGQIQTVQLIERHSYQQDLTDPKQLYGVLSQKAFKGKLDLSRVPLPTEDTDQAEGIEFGGKRGASP